MALPCPMSFTRLLPVDRASRRQHRSLRGEAPAPYDWRVPRVECKIGRRRSGPDPQFQERENMAEREIDALRRIFAALPPGSNLTAPELRKGFEGLMAIFPPDPDLTVDVVSAGGGAGG